MEDRFNQIEKAGPPVLELPVFYASDRQKICSNKDEAGQILAPLELGTATVRVPLEDHWLSKDGKLDPRYDGLAWHLNDKDATLVPYLEIRGYVAEKDTQAVLKDVKENKNFWMDLRSELSHEKSHRVYVYIHGFGSSGENAVYASGVLASQVEAPVVAFTWPSVGKVAPHLFGKGTRGLFKQDRKMIDSPKVLDDLSRFLSTMKRELPEDTKLELVAHSLGNRLMTKYLHSKSTETFDSLDFLAPDVDKKFFLSALNDITRKAKHVAVYMNPHDRVLAASGLNNLLEMHSFKKLGRSKISAPGIDFINYESIAQPKGIGHYVPFDQLGSIERTQAPLSDDPQNQYYFIRRTKIEHKPQRDKTQTAV